MDLYIATGPFHVFNAVNLKLHENADAPGELLIVDIFLNAPKMAESIRLSGLFSHVYLLDQARFKSLIVPFYYEASRGRRWMLLLKFMLDRRTHACAPIANHSYSRIYMAGFIDAFSQFVSQQLKHNHARLFYFDDGLGTRISGQIRFLGFKWKLKPFKDFLYPTEHVDGLYVYSPDLVYGRFNYPMKRQIRPQLHDRPTIQKVFSYDPDADSIGKYRFIYLHGGYELYPSLSGFDACDRQLAILTCNSMEDAAVCVHPASGAVFSGCNCMPKQRPPFEISCMFQDMKSKVLITGFSTAAFNPKFIFDQEPYIILTYKLFPPEMLDTLSLLPRGEQAPMMDQMLIHAYKDPSRIYIPETKEDFLLALGQTRNRLEHAVG